MPKGKYIVIDGTDGSGKTSVMTALMLHLSEQKYNFISTKEPGNPNNVICTKIREIVVNSECHIDDQTELFLMLADRAQNISQCVIPALQRGQIVLSDRSLYSSVAYQGYGRFGGNKESLDFIANLNVVATQGVVPDLAIFLTTTPETMRIRIKKRNLGIDRFERNALLFQEKVKEGFEHIYKLSKEDPTGTKIELFQTDCLTLDEVCDKVKKAVDDFLRLEKK